MARELLMGEVELKDLLDRLAFAEEEVKDAALDQAKLYLGAITYRVKCLRVKMETEAVLTDLKTDLSLQLRRKHAAAGKKGITETHLKELVDSSEKVREARDAAMKAKRHEEWAQGLVDAYEQRRSSVKIMAGFAYLEDEFRPSGETEVNKLKSRREHLKRSLGKDEEDL